MSPDPIDPVPPQLEFVYAMEAALGPVVPIGATPDGTRRIIPILSGKIVGPNISARILGGGSDWQLLRGDGVTVADATYAAETDDGEIIQIRNRGLRHGPAEVMARLAKGETVDPSAYYFRAAPQFIAPTGRYDWLNASIFVCTGARYAASIWLEVWRVV